MKIAVPKERAPGERRVSLVPDVVAKLVGAGHTVSVERGAGSAAFYPDDAYVKAGATLADGNAVYAGAEIVTRVGKPSDDEVAAIPRGATLVGMLAPLGDAPSVDRYARAGISAIAMELIPRTTLAQAMDALSSQASIAGYKAVLLAAETLPKYFPMLTTAAGTVQPAKVLVIGAGVAGLQAIGTARRLGAAVTGYDARSAVKEQVQSLGAKFLEIAGVEATGQGGYARELTPEEIAIQRAAMVKAIGGSDVVITTAAVPGRKAPVLITEEAIAAMAPGSVIVDLAAETGGNSALTRPGEIVVSENGVTIIGTLNLPASVPAHASQLYARNVQALLTYLIRDAKLTLDADDEIARGATIVRDGAIVHEPTKAALPGGAA
jgi:proton-translocating NAD(P)+ transhydrogenase subunit alpha